MKQAIENFLRRRRFRVRLRELNREGWRRALIRYRYQRQILPTPPLRTSASGPVEVRVLTWRKDWINLVWALKSFYHFSAADYPLHIHDGGLFPWQWKAIRHHFPDAFLHPASELDEQVDVELRRRGFVRSAEYRKLNVTTRKIWDFFLFSEADRILTIDSDIIFFRRPSELLDDPPASRLRANRYNRDATEFYAMTTSEIEADFGFKVPPLVNSGLGSIWRESMDFALVDRLLHHPKLFADRWVTEQTLHAICSARYGLEILPETYMLSLQPGLLPTAVCKHYVTDPRPLLYREGMRKLIDGGFIRAISEGKFGQA
jgi:hypothetical protein